MDVDSKINSRPGLADIKSEYLARREALDSSNAENLPHEKETLRDVIREKFDESNMDNAIEGGNGGRDKKEHDESKDQTNVPPALVAAVQELINVAFSQDLSKAIKKARATKNEALVDAFHDVLVDEVFNELVEQNVIKRF